MLCQVYINLWIFFFNSIGYVPFLMQEGRPSLAMSLCVGKIPLKFVKEPILQNFFVITVIPIMHEIKCVSKWNGTPLIIMDQNVTIFYIVVSYGKKSFKVWAQERPKRMYVSSACIIITVLLNISYAIFRHVYKYLDSQRFTQFKQLKLKLPKNIYREQVHSYLMNFCCVVFFTLDIFLIMPAASKQPHEIEQFPTYLFLYIDHNIKAHLLLSILYGAVLSKNSRMRREVFQDLKTLIGVN